MRRVAQAVVTGSTWRKAWSAAIGPTTTPAAIGNLRWLYYLQPPPKGDWRELSHPGELPGRAFGLDRALCGDRRDHPPLLGAPSAPRAGLARGLGCDQPVFLVSSITLDKLRQRPNFYNLVQHLCTEVHSHC